VLVILDPLLSSPFVLGLKITSKITIEDSGRRHSSIIIVLVILDPLPTVQERRLPFHVPLLDF